MTIHTLEDFYTQLDLKFDKADAQWIKSYIEQKDKKIEELEEYIQGVQARLADLR